MPPRRGLCLESQVFFLTRAPPTLGVVSHPKTGPQRAGWEPPLSPDQRWAPERGPPQPPLLSPLPSAFSLSSTFPVPPFSPSTHGSGDKGRLPPTFCPVSPLGPSSKTPHGSLPAGGGPPGLAFQGYKSPAFFPLPARATLKLQASIYALSPLTECPSPLRASPPPSRPLCLPPVRVCLPGRALRWRTGYTPWSQAVWAHVCVMRSSCEGCPCTSLHTVALPSTLHSA